MRVAVVHNLTQGGAWRRMRCQCERLEAELIEVCLSTATPFSDQPVVIPLSLGSDRLPRALRPPARYFDHLALEAAWRRCSRRIVGLGCDVVFLNPCRFLQAPPISIEELPPTVYFCDEPRRVDNEPAAAAQRNAVTRPLYAQIYRRERQLDQRTTRAVRTIATNSSYTAEQIRRVYGRTATVVCMGVLPAGASPVETPPEEDYLLSVGTLIPSKGHELVIGAAAAARERRALRIVAPRDDAAYRARLEDLARRFGVALHIEIGVSEPRLRALYRGAFATLYLARQEPFGLVALEAQAEGCPVIVSDEGGLPETIEPGVTGWSCPREASAAAALVDRLSSTGLRDDMARAAREWASQQSWQRSADQLAALLRDAAA